MAPAQGRENVAVFNPIVLALPNWHPDGPDGDVDGYVIPFVFPDDRESGRSPNRRAKIAIALDKGEWRAGLRNCQSDAMTADQARAFAGAWIRAAEVLDAIASRAAAKARLDDDVVDCEVVDDDDEDQDVPDNADGSCGACGAQPGDEHRPRCSNWLRGIRRSREAEGRIGTPDRTVVPRVCCDSKFGDMHAPDCAYANGTPRGDCPACNAGTCTFHTGPEL